DAASTVTDLHGHAEPPERSEDRRFPLVRTRDLVAGLSEDPGDRAHAGSPDADQVDVAARRDASSCQTLPGPVHRRAATARTTSARDSAAWGRANSWMEALIAPRRDSSHSR